MGYIAKIGLEMHCEISETNSKVFSDAKNSFSDIPNSNVRPLDMAFPGTLPTVNKECVKMALMMSMILNCKQPDYMYFERKNYYYPDLPKGFQITQETKPIPVGIYGNVAYECLGEEKTVRINNIHLEEDSASLDHFYDTTNIDYNRAGVPLLELVTEPDFHSADEAVAFLEHMRSIYQYAGVSDADSKKGQIRCDVNVSIMDEGLDEEDPSNWGVKVEIKNVNSFGGVRDTINYEIKRQTLAKENGTYDTEVIQQTRRWDEESQTTIGMRAKVDAIDYKYFVEPNIPKFKITKELLDEIRASIPELAYSKKKRYVDEFKLSVEDANTLVRNKDVANYFDRCVEVGIDAKVAVNWVNVQLVGYANKNNLGINELYVTPERLKVILKYLNDGTISIKQAKEVFFKVLESNKEPMEFIDLNDVQVSDEVLLEEIIDKILDNNKEQIEAYKNGRTNLFDYFVGQVMKETRGKANPNITKDILNRKLND